MNVTINKASLKDGFFLKGDYDEQMKDATRNIKFDDSNAVHDDLKEVFDALGEHLRLLCQQPVDFEGERNYTCTGFSIGSNDSGITLIGSRVLDGNRVLNLVSPFLKWENDNYSYSELSELGELIEKAKSEVKAYLFEGKHAPQKQLSLFPDEDDNTDSGDASISFITGGGETKTMPLGEFVAKTKRGKKAKATGTDDTDAEF